MGAFRYLLYAAVAASLGVYAYRAYRRWIAPRAEVGAAPGETSTVTETAAPGPAAATPATGQPAPARPPVATATSAGPSAGRGDDTPTKAPRPRRGLGFTDPYSLPSEREAGSESLVQQVIREELARKQGIDPDAPPPDDAPPTRSGLFAGGAGADAPRAVDRVSVAAALTGIRLPDDLVPLVGDAADPHHVTFISSSESAAVIGRHLGDELERLGYVVRSETDVVAVATKGAVTLRVTLHPDAGTERLDGAARYPTAAPTSVVVEFET